LSRYFQSLDVIFSILLTRTAKTLNNIIIPAIYLVFFASLNYRMLFPKLPILTPEHMSLSSLLSFGMEDRIGG